MNVSSMRNIGGLVLPIMNVAPQAISAAVNGGSIDRFAHNMPASCVMHLAVGAESGGPSAISVVSKLQHSPDGSTWADYINPGEYSTAETAAVTAADSDAAKAIDLSSADRFIRAVVTPTLTGGTSPAVEVEATIVIGGETPAPAI